MAIVLLEQIPIPPAGPVSRQQQTQFVNNYNKLGPPNLDYQDLNTIRILGLIYSLNALRGVDYRKNYPQLLADAAAYTNGISLFDKRISLAAVEWSNGNRADPTLSNNVEALCQQGPIFDIMGQDQLDRIITMLEIRIGQ